MAKGRGRDHYYLYIVIVFHKVHNFYAFHTA